MDLRDVMQALFMLFAQVVGGLNAAQRRVVAHAVASGKRGRFLSLGDEVQRLEEDGDDLTVLAEMTGQVFGAVLSQREDVVPGEHRYWTHEFRAVDPTTFYAGHGFDRYEDAQHDFGYRCKSATRADAVAGPRFPADLLGCDRECGFVPAGVGFQCKEGDGCGRYVHPDDPGFQELKAYHEYMLRKAQAEEVTR